MIDRDLYVFGGKTRLFTRDNNGAFTYTPHSDHVYGDLWKLSIERARAFSLQYALTDVPIPDNSVFFATVSGFVDGTVLAESDGVTPRTGLCIDKAVVNVRNRNICICLYFRCMDDVYSNILFSFYVLVDLSYFLNTFRYLFLHLPNAGATVPPVPIPGARHFTGPWQSLRLS